MELSALAPTLIERLIKLENDAAHALAVAAVAEHLAWRALPCQKVLSSPDRRGPWRDACDPSGSACPE